MNPAKDLIETAAEDRLSEQRVWLIFRQPFFGQQILHLQMKPSWDIPYLRIVPPKEVYFNPEYISELRIPALRMLLMAIVLKLDLGHPFRLGDRDLETWNKASNYAVNYLLNNILSDPDNRDDFEWWDDPKPLLDTAFYDKSAEWIYDQLPKPTPTPALPGGSSKPEPGDTPSPSGEGESEEEDADEGDSDGEEDGEPQPDFQLGEDSSPTDFEAPKGSEDEIKSAEQQWFNNMVEAAMTSRKRGTLPADIENLITHRLKPDLPWEDELKQYARTVLLDDFAWHRPMEEFVAHDILLPGLESDGGGVFIACRDTSGSIYSVPELLGRFMANLNAIHSELRPEGLWVLDIDAIVQKQWFFERNDDIDPPYPTNDSIRSARGGGGTSFRPAFQWVEEQGIEPDVLIYFTDLHGDWPEKAPPYPVIWVVYGAEHYKPSNLPPYGKIIYTKDKQ